MTQNVSCYPEKKKHFWPAESPEALLQVAAGAALCRPFPSSVRAESSAKPHKAPDQDGDMFPVAARVAMA